MDQVRGASFLQSRRTLVPGARVLDLFAGTGGLGIEALSRGALGGDVRGKRPSGHRLHPGQLGQKPASGSRARSCSAWTRLPSWAACGGTHVSTSCSWPTRHTRPVSKPEDFAARLLAERGPRRPHWPRRGCLCWRSRRGTFWARIIGWLGASYGKNGYGTAEVLFLRQATGPEEAGDGDRPG